MKGMPATSWPAAAAEAAAARSKPTESEGRMREALIETTGEVSNVDGYLLTVSCEAKVFVEEGQDVILEAIRNGAGVGSGVDLKAVGDTVAVQDRMQLASVNAQAVLITDVHRNGTVLLEVADVLIDKGKRRIRSELCDDLRLRNTVLGGQVEEERRVPGVRRPRRRCCVLGDGESRRLRGKVGWRLRLRCLSFAGDRALPGLLRWAGTTRRHGG